MPGWAAPRRTRYRKKHDALLGAGPSRETRCFRGFGEKRVLPKEGQLMKKLKSPMGLKQLRRKLAAARDAALPMIVIPAGTCGRASGATELVRAARQEISRGKLAQKVGLRVTGCHGFCQMEPSLLVEPQRTFYPRVSAKDMPRIIVAVAKGEVLKDLLFKGTAKAQPMEKQEQIPFFKKQVRTIMAASEKVDPLSIEDYLVADGYASLAQVLSKGKPAGVVAEVKASGLRGRGGAGFHTGLKWEILAAEPGEGGKYLVCNADEGDPGAYMDRSVLEGNPHSIIEGMLIGAYATGAASGVVYVRNEYPLAIEHLKLALRLARDLGLLGRNILGSGLDFDIELVVGAGAFVCGEETALIASIEGRMGEPRQRPPFPVQKGIRGRPTAINNVETWANIPVIIRRGAREFARMGTKGNSGTKIFSLVGKVKYTGLVEVPMGISIDQIVNDIGGGPANGVGVKGVQTGGPSGGCIPARKFDLPIDYDSLGAAKSIMGSGGMIVMDEHTCMVDVAKYFMNFLKDESCGKCFSCRKGTQRMHEILEDICKGEGAVEKLDLLEELANVVRDTTMCGLGQTAPNPVLSTLHYFREEYLEHIEKGCCRAGVCKELITYSINKKCTGCGACLRVCSAKAISGGKKKLHVVDAEKCIKCGACRDICQFSAVVVK